MFPSQEGHWFWTDAKDSVQFHVWKSMKGGSISLYIQQHWQCLDCFKLSLEFSKARNTFLVMHRKSHEEHVAFTSGHEISDPGDFALWMQKKAFQTRYKSAWVSFKLWMSNLKEKNTACSNTVVYKQCEALHFLTFSKSQLNYSYRKSEEMVGR